MDELLRDFLTETTEHIEGAENHLVMFERNPTDASLITSIFRLLHTIKGTSSFLGLSRLQHTAHAAENLIGALRDGAQPTQMKVSMILAAIDRIKAILAGVDEQGGEPEGDDSELIEKLEALAVAADEPDAGLESVPAPVPALVASADAAHDHDDAAEGQNDDPEDIAEADAPAPKSVTGKKINEAAKQGAGQQQGQGQGQGQNGKSSETIRVTVDTIERIMQLVSELVLTRNQLLELTKNRGEDPVKAPLQRLSGLTTDLQDAVMRARMQPVGRLYANLPRLVRELSTDLNKKIDLVTEGADTELDRQLIDIIRDPLTHIIRNCADHGIEMPEDRVAAGKPERGEIRVAASHEAGQITIDIIDDGKGLDVDRIKDKVLRTGLATEAELQRLSNEEIYRFIFEPGFSTAAKVTSVSGRGVGMDVVRTNIESIGGGVSLYSRRGQGTRLSMKIPLTLAIAPALIVQTGTQRFALPQHAVVEAVSLSKESPHQIEKLQNALVLKLREEVLPIVDLRSVLGFADESETQRDDRLAVIMRVGGQPFGVIVDAVSDVQEIVVKPLSASISHLKVFSGHTILGDGSVVLILDPSGISTTLGIEKSAEKSRDIAKESSMAADRTRLILFRAGQGVQKVLPLSLVSRIEMVDANRIEISDGRHVMLHNTRLMPLVPVDQCMDVSTGTYPVLVVSTADHTFGLIVDEIVDVVELALDVQLESSRPDIVGSAELRGHTVELIDTTHFMQLAYPNGCKAAGVAPKSVLLIESDTFAREMLNPMLSAGGYKVVAVTSTAEAEARFEKGERFDAILVAADLPKGAAHRFVRAKRKIAGFTEMPIVALTGKANGPSASALSSHGYSLGISKYDRHSLLSTIAALLDQIDDAADADEFEYEDRAA